MQEAYKWRGVPINHFDASSRTYSAFRAERAPLMANMTARLQRYWQSMEAGMEREAPEASGSDPALLDSRGNFFLTAPHKLQHDAEQLLHLIRLRLIPHSFMALVLRYLRVLKNLKDRRWHDYVVSTLPACDILTWDIHSYS